MTPYTHYLLRGYEPARATQLATRYLRLFGSNTAAAVYAQERAEVKRDGRYPLWS